MKKILALLVVLLVPCLSLFADVENVLFYTGKQIISLSDEEITFIPDCGADFPSEVVKIIPVNENLCEITFAERSLVPAPAFGFQKL